MIKDKEAAVPKSFDLGQAASEKAVETEENEELEFVEPKRQKVEAKESETEQEQEEEEEETTPKILNESETITENQEMEDTEKIEEKPVEIIKKQSSLLCFNDDAMSSCNGSQAIQIKKDLGMDTNNNEFSFNGGGAPVEPAESQSRLIKTLTGQTIRISPVKKQQDIQLKPEAKDEIEIKKEDKLEVDSIIDLEIRDDEDLDLDSQNSQVKDIINNTSARDAPSYTKSYVSNT